MSSRAARCIAPRCGDTPQPGSMFCRSCEQAPAGQRGGWLSAERRRRKMKIVDASQIIRRLWVGSAPPFDCDLPDFDVMVLCAMEIQPETTAFHGRTIRCPIDDSILTRAELSRVLISAQTVAASLASRKRVLVTCAAGLNRSALVASFAIARVTRLGADEIIALMRAKRSPSALGNQSFQLALRQLVGAGRNPWI